MRIQGSNFKINDGVQKIIQNESSAAFSDKKLNNKELEGLKQIIYNSYIQSDDKGQTGQKIKEQAVEFLNKANSFSKGFFGGGKISPKEMEKLKELANSPEMKNNPLVQQICEKLDLAVNNKSEKSDVQKYNNSEFKPSQMTFSKNNYNDEMLICQGQTGLKSSDGDCGPSSAAMILRKFGFIKGKSDAQAVQSVRDSCDAPKSAPFAIDEKQQATAISELSGGQIKKLDSMTFEGGAGKSRKDATLQDISKMSDFINNQMNSGRQVVLETGSPFGGGEGRHYMVVDHIRDDGIFMIADPALGRVVPYSPEDLMSYINQTTRNTELLSYGKN